MEVASLKRKYENEISELRSFLEKVNFFSDRSNKKIFFIMNFGGGKISI